MFTPQCNCFDPEIREVVNGYDKSTFGIFRFRVKDVLFLVQRMEPALSSAILKFPHFLLASLQAKTAVISKLVDDLAGSII